MYRPATVRGPMTAQEIHQRAHDALTESSDAGAFAWPFDRFSGEPWGYALHVGTVCAWNRTGREQSFADFARVYLTIGRVDELVNARRDSDPIRRMTDAFRRIR